jgi:hypothetical protein
MVTPVRKVFQSAKLFRRSLKIVEGMLRFSLLRHYLEQSQCGFDSEERMARLSICFFIFMFGALPASLVSSERPMAAQSSCTFPLTQTVRIPVVMMRTGEATEANNLDAATLMISPGATDELPEGPAGFDVADDGSLMIADPLRKRIAVFDAEGKFRKALKIGFPADSVTVTKSGTLVIQDASTGTVHVVGRDGQERSKESVNPPEQMEAAIVTGKTGIVARIGADGSRLLPLDIRFDRSGSALVSLEALADDAGKNTFVALESTVEGSMTEEVDVNKVVRKYSLDGSLAGETNAISIAYYVTPVNELRVHMGNVYQLQVTKSEVKVNVWNTSKSCSQP